MGKATPVKVGLIGSGGISGIYLKNMTQTFSILDVVGCSDLIGERSLARAQEFGIRQMTNREILNDPEIEIVVNTTYPTAHYEVTKAALLAGKHVYCEKMMAVTMDEARELMAIAKEKNLRLSTAPDTFLGAALQTARKLIDDDFIGSPISAVAMVVRGYRPDFAEQGSMLPFVMLPGGGIPFDMGGYYLHALISLLGGLKRVSGFAKANHFMERFENPRHPKYDESFPINTPNMMVGALEFESGCYGTITTISECYGETPRLEIYGTKGTLVCGDPNLYCGPVFLNRVNESGTASQNAEIPLTHGFSFNARGIGVADMAWGIVNHRPHRLSAELGYHAFEVVHGIMDSCQTNRVYEMTSRCARPQPLPAGMASAATAEACLDN